MLAEGQTDDITWNVGKAYNTFSINFSKTKTKFCLSFHSNVHDKYLFVNGKEIYKFKTYSRNINFPTKFHLGSTSEKFGTISFREISFLGNVYDVSVDYYAIDKSDILKIH